MQPEKYYVIHKKAFLGFMLFLVILAAIIAIVCWPKTTYKNCGEMKSAHDTSYNAALDRDSDGKSCE